MEGRNLHTNIMQLFAPRFSWSFCLSIVFHLCTLHLCCSTANEYTKNLSNMTVPALFAFGDSLVDTGNNNDLLTLGRCNWSPYGMNFEGKTATGRFSNGRLTVDYYVEKLGIKKYLPAYLDQSVEIPDLLTGVSFASSASGFDPFTSEIALVRSLKNQLRMFKEYLRDIKAIVGHTRVELILNNSIFIVAAGSSDLGNTYFSLPFRRESYDANSYTDLMLKGASSFLKRLYRLGARNIGVSNVPPLGDTPVVRTLSGGMTKETRENYSEAARLFNAKLRLELQFLGSTKLHEANLVYFDMYSIMADLVQNKTKYGFEVVDKGCCGSGLIESGPLCNPFSVICDVKKYFFWDSFHPTEAANEIIAKKILEKYFPLFF